VKIQQFIQVSSNFPLTISIHDIQANTCKKIRSFLIFSWVSSHIMYKTINYKNTAYISNYNKTSQLPSVSKTSVQNLKYEIPI